MSSCDILSTMKIEVAPKYFQFVKSKWFIAGGCIVLGALIILGIRFATYKPDRVHYHANFAVYINGQQEQFKGAAYYTDVNACVANNSAFPSERAHMHDNVNNVVHVEAHTVTWGQFFDNLSWTLGPTLIADRDGHIYAESGQNKLNILLNGQDYTDFGGITNNVIEDKDKLLISYGDLGNSTLQQEYDAIPSTAGRYDANKDPASCSGNHGTTMHDRLVHMF